MMEDAINLANEVTATRTQRHSQSQSPPQSPTGSEKVSLDFSDHMDPSPSLISKLKNSIRRSPKSERKRTFSDDRPPKGDVEEEMPPGAQEAYNALVVRGSERSSGKDDQESEQRVSVSSDAVFSSDVTETQPHEPPALPTTGVPPARLSSSKGSGMPQPPPRPMPKPRLDPKKSELPVPKPRPEIVQRVEPIRRPPDSPEVPLKEKESHIPVPASRKESQSETKEREREQLKRTIEIVRVESPAKEREEVTMMTVDFDTKESTPEPDSDSTRRSSASEGADSSSKVMSLFDEDFSEPSPREIMSKLARESRMRRNLDHQRVLSGENQDMQAASITRTRREPSGIPAKAPPPASEEDKDEEEVDTNPLRMLRGGAIPIRTSRGAGNSPVKNTTSSLRYPKFGFQSGAARTEGDDGSGGCSSLLEPAPKLPPRAHSVSSDSEGAVIPPPRQGADSEAAPLVPPRTPLRQQSMPALNCRPRERRNPLVYSKISGCDPSSVPSWLSSPAPTSPSAATNPALHSLSAHNYSASFHASSSSPLASRPFPAFVRSVSLHDEPCPADLPQAPPRPRPHPLSIPPHPNCVPSVGGSLSVMTDSASHHYYGVDESALDSDSNDVFYSSRRSLPPPPVSPKQVGGGGGVSGRKFSPHSVKCSLEQLGFYNQHDPFWVQTVQLPEIASALDTTASSEEVSPLLLVNYKNSDNVSYEDLLDFGLDR